MSTAPLAGESARPAARAESAPDAGDRFCDLPGPTAHDRVGDGPGVRVAGRGRALPRVDASTGTLQAHVAAAQREGGTDRRGVAAVAWPPRPFVSLIRPVRKRWLQRPARISRAASAASRWGTSDFTTPIPAVMNSNVNELGFRGIARTTRASENGRTTHRVDDQPGARKGQHFSAAGPVRQTVPGA